jgi:flagellar biosynthesis chaperone FliJ
MAKNTVKKIKELKGEKPTKISNEHLNKLQGTINTLNRTQMQIGVFHTNIHQLSHNVDEMNNQLTLMQSEFEKEYGTKDINISDGTINYEQTN